MSLISGIDWENLFLPQTPLLETIIRGTVVYLVLFLMLRVVLKRESGSVGITDLLVVVLLADAAQNAMSGDYHSIFDGILLVGTILFWSYFLDWLGYRYPRFQRLIHPPALLLVKDGRMLKQNMRKEFITDDELQAMLRQQGIENLLDVKAAYIEGDGAISVIRNESNQKAYL
jgi:uncharacterized membrane protein YcaP (DUF421 family)